MTEYSCGISSCQTKASVICLCRNPAFLSCASHGHFDRPQNEHPCQKIHREISNSEEQNLLSLCSLYEAQINNSIEVANLAFNNTKILIERNFQKLIDSYTAFKEDIQKVRSMSKRNQLISVLEDASEAERVISEYILNPSRKPNRWENYCLLENEDQAKSALLNNYNEQNDQSKIINIQRPHTKRLIKIDVNDGRVYEVEIPRTDNFSYASGWCKINNDLLLIHGGVTDYNSETKNFTMSGCTYMINTTFNMLTHVTNGPEKSDIGNGTLYKGEIYFFGGFNKISERLDSVNKFGLLSREWKNASNLPQPMGYCTSAIAETLIYITGSPSTEIFQYYPEENIYTSIIDCLETYKTIFFFNKKLYMIFDKIIKMIDESNTVIDQNIDISNMFMLGHATQHGNSLYFVLGKYNLSTGRFTSSKLCKINGETNSFMVVKSGVLEE